ncbi:DUF3604 domain-containing protein [Chloroflexota bacterium]
MYRIDRGKARIHPADPVEAGSFVSIKYQYTAGHPIDDGGRIKIVFRQVGDFGTPQFDDPSKPNYCSISTNGNCIPQPSWDARGHARPWSPTLLIRITKGFLKTDEVIKIVFGDRSGGSDGWRMQTFCEDTFEFKTLVDAIATSDFRAVPISPTLKIVPGKPVRAVCIAPSQVDVSRGFFYYLKLEDKWGNPIRKPVRSDHPGFKSSGVNNVMSQDKETGLQARSNPIKVVSQKLELHAYWADFHGQSEETVGSNTIDDYFTFARDISLLDICAHQGNDFEITDDFWRTINKTTKRFYGKDRFVTFPGYEWSGNTPLGGDRNIYFAAEGGLISRSSSETLSGRTSRYDDSPTAIQLFNNLKEQRIKSFAFAHVGGRYADLSMHDSDIEVGVEVHSAWGTFEWLVEDALKRGYHVGICANSDGHKGRPGASYPGARTFGSMGGLTCILSKRLDRKSVFDALKARHFYATTGNRCLVDLKLTAVDGRTAIIGDVIQIDKSVPILNVSVAGTAPVENVAVHNGLNVVQTMRSYNAASLGKRIKIVWGGAEVMGRARLVQWDGSLRINGNSITRYSAINFWNADKQLQQIDHDLLEWKTGTTGGIAGVIIELAEPDSGSLRIETAQRIVEVDVSSIGIESRIWNCGGIQKRIEIYRLPSKPCPDRFAFELPLPDLHEGDNPIYVRMLQEDGHMAWTSPVYICID